MHKNCHKSYLDSEPALHKCRVDNINSLKMLLEVTQSRMGHMTTN